MQGVEALQARLKVFELEKKKGCDRAAVSVAVASAQVARASDSGYIGNAPSRVGMWGFQLFSHVF